MKNTWRRVLLSFITLCIVSGIFSAQDVFADQTSGVWTYTISNGTAKIMKYTGNSANITIPEYLDGYRVTELASNLFRDYSSLKAVSLPNTLECIGYCAFCGCTNLTSITFPVNLEQIQNGAFNTCTSLTEIIVNSTKITKLFGGYIGDTGIFEDAGKYTNGITVRFNNGVTVIPDEMFYEYHTNCFPRITKVVISDSVKSIGYNAFRGCANLNSVIWGNGLESIGSSAFCDCTKLSSVTFPLGLETIGNGAFNNCASLSEIVINSKKITSLFEGYIGDTGIFEKAGKYSDGITVRFGNSVIAIPSELFYEYHSNDYPRVKKVIISKSVTSIGARAFVSCKDLSDVYYSGSEIDWKQIKIGTGNTPLLSANIHYAEVHNHSWTKSQITRKATEQRTGIRTYYCNCGAAKTEAIPKVVFEVTVNKTVKSIKTKVKKNSITLLWKKDKRTLKKYKNRIKKIDIQVATDKNFIKIVKNTSVSKNATRYVFKGKKKMTYWIRIRYRATDGVSKWVVKKVKTKR